MLVILFKIIFVLVCFALIGIILIQRARGGGLAGAFGGGGSETFMGNLQNKEIVRYTTYLGAAFLLLAVTIDFVPQDRGTQGLEELSGVAPVVTMPAEEEASSQDGTEPVDVDEDLPTVPNAVPADNPTGEGQ